MGFLIRFLHMGSPLSGLRLPERGVHPHLIDREIVFSGRSIARAREDALPLDPFNALATIFLIFAFLKKLIM